MDLFAMATDREIKRFIKRFSDYTRECEKLMKIPSLGCDEDLFGFSVDSAWKAYAAGVPAPDYARGVRATKLPTLTLEEA